MAQSFKKNQESLYYIRPSDFRFVGLLLLVKEAHIAIAHIYRSE